MKGIYYTSDLHFGHKNITKFNPDTRPFQSMEEMDEKIIDSWNNTVKSGDTVYILGDVSFYKVSKTVEILSRLRGQKILIIGNHDTHHIERDEFIRSFIGMGDLMENKVDGQLMVMCHFPIYEWDQMHRGAIHLHGHTHGKVLGIGGKILDVGWDNVGKVISHEEVIERMANLPVREHLISEH